jgi:hypothetical protein
MDQTHCVAALSAVPFVFLCLFAFGCGAKKAPATSAVQPKPAAAAPAVPSAAAPAAAAPVPAPKPSGAGAPGPAAAAPAPLIGHVTRGALEYYETWKTLRAEDYTPDAAAVQTIASRWRGVRVLVILGTWCKDSKRDLPRFFKIADLGKLPLDDVTFIAVDRSKKDPEGLTETHKIERVPTFVFFRGATEVGRVTEKPTTTLEADIAAILTK